MSRECGMLVYGEHCGNGMDGKVDILALDVRNYGRAADQLEYSGDCN